VRNPAGKMRAARKSTSKGIVKTMSAGGAGGGRGGKKEREALKREAGPLGGAQVVAWNRKRSPVEVE